MKPFFVITLLFLLVSGIFAQDLIILRDGNVIEAKIIEISPTEIRYRRFNHLDGPIIVIFRTDVLSIRYENGTVEIFNPASVVGQERAQGNFPLDGTSDPQLGLPLLVQSAVNILPAIPIAGRNLKFELGTNTWVAKVNGSNTLSGTLTFLQTNQGYILTLKQTHTYIRNQSINTPGPDINLEYIVGPPASLRTISRSELQERGISQAELAEVGQTEITQINQTEKLANVRDNWLSAGLTTVGAGLKYERMFNSYWSLGIDAYYQTFGLEAYIEFGVNVTPRFYPFGKILYIGTGFGVYGCYAYIYNNRFDDDYQMGFAISPELGVKLDLGRPGGFFMDIGLKVPQKFSDGFYGFGYSYFTLVPYLGFGGAF